MEHNLRKEELGNIALNQYFLGAKFCRQIYRHGGLCILSRLMFILIILSEYSKIKDFEICAVQLHISSYIIIIIAIFRSPSGDFTYFLVSLEFILNQIYNNSIDIILCGDLNVNYLNDNHTKQFLDSLLDSHILRGTVQFPMRILGSK
jgi:hypothetical protein